MIITNMYFWQDLSAACGRGEHILDQLLHVTVKSPRGYYLDTDPDPIAMVIRVELFTHKPSDTNAYWQCMVTHARLCYR